MAAGIIHCGSSYAPKGTHMPPLNMADLLCMLPFALLLLAFIYNLYRKWWALRTTGELEAPQNLEENTPLDYAMYGVLWVYHRLGKGRAAETTSGYLHPYAKPSSPLLTALAVATHILVIGPSRSGKTSLVHALAMLWRHTDRVVVCDPDAAPGLWDRCEVHGGGDDFAAIEAALAELAREIAQRRELRAHGVRVFSPLRVVLCEYADIARYCEQARSIIEDCLRRGGKIGISLVLDVQDRQRKTLDLDGATHLLNNFSHVCEVRKGPGGKRTATVTTNDGEESGAVYEIPILPDLDLLIRQHSLPHDSSESAPVQRSLRGIFPAEDTVPVQYGTGGTQRIETPNTSSIHLPQDDEAVVIRYLLEHLGSKNKVADFLGGSKTTAYKRINRALGEAE